jgi:glycosyltransferase involved in cell wall biosynthesis
VRIAIIAPPWVPVPPPAYGGTEAVLDNLARGLADAGHEVLLFATGDSTCEVPTRFVLERAAGMVGAGSATELRHVVHAYDAVLDWRADIVHDHTLVGPVYASRFEIPVVTTNHGPFNAELSALYRVMGDSVAIIALSNHHAASAAGIPLAGVIHHGVDVDAFPVGDGDGDYVVFLGRMSPDKGVHVAARAARAAGVPLRIAAKMREPAELAYFNEHIAPMLGGAVQYVGEVGGPDKLELLARARCLLNPIQWHEPFGMVMIEALACGTPVVATPHGSVPELITDGVTGFVRPTETELADMLLQVDQLDRGECRKTAAERFSTQRMVADHLEIYERALTKCRGRRNSRIS